MALFCFCCLGLACLFCLFCLGEGVLILVFRIILIILPLINLFFLFSSLTKNRQLLALCGSLFGVAGRDLTGNFPFFSLLYFSLFIFIPCLISPFSPLFLRQNEYLITSFAQSDEEKQVEKECVNVKV